MDFKKTVQERMKNQICLQSHIIEVFDQEIQSIFPLNSYDKFFLSFFDEKTNSIFKIPQNDKVKKIDEVYFLYETS